MKKIVGFIGLAFLHLMVACSSITPWETRQWQPTAVTDFKSVPGKWEGLLTSNDPWCQTTIGRVSSFTIPGPANRP
jgi:hypothetical protein